MSFPTPWVVTQEHFGSTGEDDLGNDTGGWGDPVSVHVIAWQPSSVESLSGPGGVQYASRVVSDVDMAVPPTLAVSVLDRFQLPGEDGYFEVVAIEDANHGFHQWQPGTIVKLRRVSG